MMNDCNFFLIYFFFKWTLFDNVNATGDGFSCRKSATLFVFVFTATVWMMLMMIYYLIDSHFVWFFLVSFMMISIMMIMNVDCDGPCWCINGEYNNIWCTTHHMNAQFFRSWLISFFDFLFSKWVIEINGNDSSLL